MKVAENVFQLMKELERRSKIIRSARIEASKRYKDDDNFYRFITIFYSIIVTVISIRFAFGLNHLDIDGGQELSIILLVMSVFVTLFTMYVSIKNAGEKVGRFQSNYMELTRLLAEIQLANTTYGKGVGNDINKAIEDYEKFSKRYASLLTQSDNHDDIDYWRAIKREEENNDEKLEMANNKIKVFNRWKYIKRTIALLSVPLLLVLLFVIEYIFYAIW